MRSFWRKRGGRWIGDAVAYYSVVFDGGVEVWKTDEATARDLAAWEKGVRSGLSMSKEGIDTHDEI